MQTKFAQVNINLFGLFESLPHVLANSKKNNTNKSCVNCFIKLEKWANQFPEVNTTLAEEIPYFL